MKSKRIQAIASLGLFLGLSAAFVWLTAETHPVPTVAAEEHEHEHTEPSAVAGSDDEHDHDHGAEVGGAPVTLDELRQIECEHDTPILDCDECRYEVGVAKIDPSLAKGLVHTHEVAPGTRIDSRLRLTGEIQLDLTRVVEISSAGSGRVERIKRVLGDTVEAANVLASIQSSEFGRAQADFLEALTKRDLAQEVFERERRLSEQKIGSEADFLVAQQQLAAAEATAAATRKRLELFGLSDEKLEALAGAGAAARFGQLILTTPIDGTVIEQNIVRGQLIDPADVLYRVADLSHVWVWCNVYEPDFAALHQRMETPGAVSAEIRVEGFPGETFSATVDMVDSRLDRDTRTLRVRLSVENPQGKLKPGMFVTAFISAGEALPVLHVPETAVLSDEREHFVFVRLSDEFWVRRDVQVGPADNGAVQVHAGLAGGETVASGGAFMFKSEVLKEKMGAGCAH
jgi:cobalt-zinc-cadmium efflux system membrane fusion protein